MRTLYMLAIAFLAVLPPGCSSNDGDDGGDDGQIVPDAPMNPPPDAPDNPGPPDAACANLNGSWAITGACGADLCTITHAACTITQVSCVSGAESTSGSVTGNMFSYTGTSGGGVPSTCAGTVAGDTMSGSCTLAVGSCAFSGNRQ